MTMTQAGANGVCLEGADSERLLSSFVELRGPQIGSTTDSLNAYDVLHDTGYLRQRDSFYKWFLSLLRPRPGQRLLDISCGQGAFLHFAVEAGLRATGLDLSPVAMTITASRVPAAGASVADAEQLPYAEGTFDYVTNIGSLEHYFHPHSAVREMARVLRPGGRALILTPNTFGLLGNVLYAWHNGDVFDDGQPLQRYGTRAQWCRLLEQNGLLVKRVFKYERAWPRTMEDLCWYVLHPHKLVRPLLSWVIPLNLSSFLVYMCSKSD
jgi:SAM-dependent methyltransferase